MKEEKDILEEFWKMMNDVIFVKTDGKDIPNVIQDMEATVYITGEFDKYAIDDFLRQTEKHTARDILSLLQGCSGAAQVEQRIRDRYKI